MGEKMTGNRKSVTGILLAGIFCLLPVTPVFSAVELMPGVTEEMLSYDYWLSEVEEKDSVLADKDTVSRLNKAFLSCEDSNMNDLVWEESTFNGAEGNLARWRSAMTELSGYLDGKHYDAAEKTVSGEYVIDILENLDDSEASEKEKTRYGICVNRSDIRAYPTDLLIADDPGDNDFDNVQLSSIRVGEPVTIYGESKDGGYYYCHTTCVSGWIPSEDIALCRNKREWLKAWQFTDDQVMVVTESKFSLESSNTSPELSGHLLTMGTVLQKVEEKDRDKLITNRSLYYNYPVWIPVRNEEGMYEKRQALISAHHGVSDGFLPLTTENIVKQAYEALGDTYGWGGMLEANDCSGYVRDVYKCFGLELPRNTTWQAAMPSLKYDLSVAEEEDKKKLFDELPPGAVLFFKGHEMIYLGHKGDDYYVISSASSMKEFESEDKARIRSVIINNLDAKRLSGSRWIEDIYEAMIPYAENEKNVSIPVFTSEEKEKEEVSENKADNGTASENGTDKNSPSENQAYETVSFDDKWEYAGNSKINNGSARLYRSGNEDRKNKTVCINAGHGTKGGDSAKTLCHPDGSPKLVSGSTEKGATEATAISQGATMKNGDPEGKATLKAALVLKEKLLKEGYDVLMIREEDDVQLDNIARTLMANGYADAHIALHYDSTDTDKGIFYCSVPDDEGYRNMEPVRSHWKEHERLGKSLIYGMKNEGFKTWNNGMLPMDLTQTSYSTIPSVDLEIGDTASDISGGTLKKAAEGITEGLDHFFGSK